MPYKASTGAPPPGIAAEGSFSKDPLTFLQRGLRFVFV